MAYDARERDAETNSSQSMTPTEYIAAALRTEHTPDFISTKHGEAHDRMLARMMHALLGMMSELGELADQLKKHLIYERSLDSVNLVEELGDGDWYRALMADALKVGFEESWRKNIAKLQARYPHKFTFEAATTRDLAAERAALEGKITITMVIGGHDYPTQIDPSQPLGRVVNDQLKAMGFDHWLVSGWEASCEKSGTRLAPGRSIGSQLTGTVLQITKPIGYGG